MKTSRSFFLLLLAIMLFSGCEKLEIPSEEQEELSEKQQVTIKTRSISDEVQYPLSVYAFDSDGKCSATQTLNSSSDNLALSLSKGSYHIVAVSKTEGYTLPKDPTLTTIIPIANENNSASLPLQMGQADIKVATSSQTVNLVLSYKVTPISLNLSQIPSDITAVSVSVSQQYSAIAFNGDYSLGKTSTINLTKSGEDWTADSYVYPGSSSQTVLSISLTNSAGTTTYGYTYNLPLQVATPYKLSGTYSDDLVSLSGEISTKTWNEPISFDFSFGPGSQTSGGDNPSQYVSDFPVAGSVWNGHVVAYVYDDMGNKLSPEDTENLSSVNLLLLSLNEWNNIKSAQNTTNPEDAIDIMNSYTEGDISNWTIPTEAEVYYLTSLYNITFDTFEPIDNALISQGGCAIGALTDDDSNIRFLCEDAKKTYVWRKNPDIRNAGSTVKYSLRLVSHVKVDK